MNLTYRIESYTIGGQVLISETTLQEVGPDLVEIVNAEERSPKGVKGMITIYEIGGIKGKHQLFLPKQMEYYFELPEPINVRYSALKDKDVGVSFDQGQISSISEKGVIICVDPSVTELPKDLVNLKLNFTDYHNEKITDDIYGKVVKGDPPIPHHFYLRFTNRPPHIQQNLEALYAELSKHSSFVNS